MKYNYGNSVCISSQVGCRMGCKFCASTGIKFVRNMTAGEILSEIISVKKYSGEKVNNVVVMGIGEPLDNYDNILKFLKLVNEKDGINIGQRHITISTCGLVDRILELAEEKLQITLAISLHAPFDDIRSEILPINNKYNIIKLIDACKTYDKKTGRRITFEYALIAGVNDSLECANELANKLKGMSAHINLIGMNKIEGSPLKRPSDKTIDEFKKCLESKGFSVTLRRELGQDISAACGQLRRKYIEDKE